MSARLYIIRDSLSRFRNVSIAWNHPSFQYGVYGIQQESSPPTSAARGSVFCEAEGVVDKEGGAAFWIHAKRDREVVQERPNGRIQKN